MFVNTQFLSHSRNGRRGGDSTIPFPRMSPGQLLPEIGLHDLLLTWQACPEFNSFHHQGVGQICPREGLFSCLPLPKRGRICYTQIQVVQRFSSWCTKYETKQYSASAVFHTRPVQVDISRTETTDGMLEIFAPRLFSLRTINMASCHQV